MSGKRKLRVSPFGLSAEYQRLISKAVSEDSQLKRASGARKLSNRPRRTTDCGRPEVESCRSTSKLLQQALRVAEPAPEDAELDGLFKPELLH